MFYINKKSRAFGVGDGSNIVPKRSEGRMKNYDSATDARAWCADREDRRQHILELISGDVKGGTFGKYIPVEVLIDTLLKNKNLDIEQLKNNIERLKAILEVYLHLELTGEQKETLKKMTTGVGKAGVDLDAFTSGKILGYNEQFGVATEVRSQRVKETAVTRQFTPQDAASTGIKPAIQKQRTGDEKKLAVEDLSNRPQVRRVSYTDTETISETAVDELSTEDTSQKVEKVQVQSGTSDATSTSGLNKQSEKTEKPTSILKTQKMQRFFPTQQMNFPTVDRDSSTAIFFHELNKKMQKEDYVGEELTCEEEIMDLELKIAEQHSVDELSGKLGNVVQKQAGILKRFCAELTNAKVDNRCLRRQIDKLGGNYFYKDIVPTSESDIELLKQLRDHDLTQLDQKLNDLRRANIVDDMDETDDTAYYKYLSKMLQCKVIDLNNIIATLKARSQPSETELTRHADLTRQLELYRRRTISLIDVVGERDKLQQQVLALKVSEEDVDFLKAKAIMADELQKELRDYRTASKQTTRSLENQISEIAAQKIEIEQELANLQAESEVFKVQSQNYSKLEKEVENLRFRTVESEVLRIENGRLKVKLSELIEIEWKYSQLCDEIAKKQGDVYKAKYEELLSVQSENDNLVLEVEKAKVQEKEKYALEQRLKEYECCISEQEEEIKKHVNHIHFISKKFRDAEERFHKSTITLREELDKKDDLLAAYEEQLAYLQNQFSASITEVSCEIACLRGYIETLEKNISESEITLSEKQRQVCMLQTHLAEKEVTIKSLTKSSGSCKDKVITEMREELERATAENDKLMYITQKIGDISKSDKQVRQILTQAKCVLKKASKELLK